jgi:uncharacterized protein YjbJ (UPF0337 family)
MTAGCTTAALPMERIMGSTKDKVTGAANQVGGKIKEGVGKVIGNEQMQAEGKIQQVKGQAQQKVGEAKSAIKDAAESVSDSINKKL